MNARRHASCILALAIASGCTQRERVEPVECAEQLDQLACFEASSDALTCEWYETREVFDLATCEYSLVGACIELEGPDMSLGCPEGRLYIDRVDGDRARLIAQCGEEPPVHYDSCVNGEPLGCDCWDVTGDTE